MSSRETAGPGPTLVYLLLFTLIFALSLIPVLFAVRAMLPIAIQNKIYTSFLRSPVVGESFAIGFILTYNLGIPVCVLASTLSVVLLFIRESPRWLKLSSVFLVLLAMLGVFVVRHALVNFGR
jgi:hypothetical protein